MAVGGQLAMSERRLERGHWGADLVSARSHLRAGEAGGRGAVQVRAKRESQGRSGEKIQKRRGRGLCSSESCWEQIRRHSSGRD